VTTSDGDSRDDTDSLPPSCRCVLLALDEHGPLSRRELAEHTGMPDQTVGWALRRLKNQGIIADDADSRDLRRKVYNIQENANV
jgi:DNA-binding transcriptional ArsR family regulator